MVPLRFAEEIDISVKPPQRLARCEVGFAELEPALETPSARKRNYTWAGRQCLNKGENADAAKGQRAWTRMVFRVDRLESASTAWVHILTSGPTKNGR